MYPATATHNFSELKFNSSPPPLFHIREEIVTLGLSTMPYHHPHWSSDLYPHTLVFTGTDSKTSKNARSLLYEHLLGDYNSHVFPDVDGDHGDALPVTLSMSPWQIIDLVSNH